MAIKPVELLIRARDEASGVLGGIGGKLTAIGAAIASYFGISAFAGAVRGAAELEAKLSEVKAVSGATAEDMVALRKAAEDAGASTKFTATEGAEALGNLTRAGLSAKDAIAALPAVLALAQAGNIGLGEASEYVTKTVMGLGLAFTDAGRVADVLAAGANASNTSVTGLAQALSYAAPVAKSLNLGLETTVAIIGKFADAGIDASRAGTALNAILSQFSDPASKFRQELGAAGIITGNFEQALRQLAAAGPAGERAILAVGTEAGPALRALLNQGIGALDELKGKLDDAAGSAAATAGVMADNLNGSLSGLSSAWDTVKNALATPVLPVLKDGVDRLAGALQRAVAEGTIGKFGDAIATAFKGAIQWAREFVDQVDMQAVTARLVEFAGQAKQTFSDVAESARNAGNVFQTVWGVMTAGVNAVMMVIYKVAEAFAGVASGIQSGIAIILTGLSKITFGSVSASFKQAAAEVKLSAEATWAVSEAFAKKASDAFNAMAEGAQTARTGWAGLTSATGDAATQARQGEAAFRSVAETLKEVGGDATAAGQKAQAAAVLQREAAESARRAVAELRTEYEAALAAGNVQLALEKLGAMKAALQATADQAKLTAQDIENAFTRLGVTSSAELARLRDAAKRDYEIIRDAGTSSARDKAEAFRVYAEKAIAANNGVVDEALKAEAAMRGLEIQTDATGKTVVRAMGEGESATRGLGDGVSRVTDRVRDLAKEAADAEKQLAAIDAKYSKPAGGASQTSTGTFNNTLPMDKAQRILDAVNSGRAITMTRAEYDEAIAQAQAAYADMQAIQRLAPGTASTAYIQSVEALMRAVQTARVNISDSNATPTVGGPAPSNSTTTVRLQVAGNSYDVATNSSGASNLIGALRQAGLTAFG